VVIGGGPAGLTASSVLARLGHEVELVERRSGLGGRLSRLAGLFPDGRPASAELTPLLGDVLDVEVNVRLSRSVVSVASTGDRFTVELDDGAAIDAGAIVLATGLDEVPPGAVPEYGHGLREGVVSSLELEDMLRIGRVTGRGGIKPRSVVLVQCSGSRTERRGVPYCSALCCPTSVKNALALKRLDPGMDVTVLYIDLRTSGPGQEAMYREARRAGVRFVRGQPSMVLEKDGQLVVCGENTLLRELYELPSDLVVLATGLRQSPSELLFRDELGIHQGTSGFPSRDASIEGVFLCGSARGPMDLPAAVIDARSCAVEVHLYLEKRKG